MSKNLKICAVCGKAFPCPPSDKTVTCSKECSKIHRSAAHKGKTNTWSNTSRKKLSERGQNNNLQKGTAAALKSSKSGHFESNVNAKDWHIISPGGKEYVFKNLNLWADKNYMLFGFDDPTDAYKVAKGIRLAKRGAQGKIRAATYKDWRVIIDDLK